MTWNTSPTTTLAVDVLPVPPSTDWTVTELIAIASIVPLTFTLNEHEAVAGIVPVILMTLLPGVAVMVPAPHDPVSPFGVLTTKPVGKLSVKLTVSETVALGFRILKLRVVPPPTGMASRLNILLITGGATTVMLAEPGLPGPPSMDVTLLVELFSTPATIPFTTMFNVQVPKGGRVIPLAVRTLGVNVSALAGHTPPDVTGPTAASPEGRLSVKPTPVSATVGFGFVIVKVRIVFWFRGTVGAANFLVSVGGATTVILAEAPVPELSLSLAVMALVELFFTPGIKPTTVVVMVQVPPARILTLLTLMAVGKPPKVNAPQPVPTTEPVCDSPAGRPSLNVTPVKSSVEFGFAIVICNVVL